MPFVIQRDFPKVSSFAGKGKSMCTNVHNKQLVLWIYIKNLPTSSNKNLKTSYKCYILFFLLLDIRKPTNIPKLRVPKELTSLQAFQVARSLKFVESFKGVLQKLSFIVSFKGVLQRLLTLSRRNETVR